MKVAGVKKEREKCVVMRGNLFAVDDKIEVFIFDVLFDKMRFHKI